ncbi:MAG TPA: cation-translocating P-type ATPase [Puia sp.]|uniref:heavy metal translocating P-type ATPase n=1 Tax=Puia sp. TaxID=2045100 RepID=UPI002B77F176|nr:cation-translocating P-type ATPase [Puia sp.]HVU93675.1 cation-translocating P-type ATPase [Puia sp.]
MMPEQEHEHPHHKEDLIRIGAVTIALLLSWLGAWKYVASFDFIAILATLVGGYPMFKEAFENIRERRMTMELSMSIAVIATLAIQQYFTGLVITFFVLIAEFLEHLLVSQGRNVIEKLIALLPRKATVRRGQIESESDITDIQPDDIVIVKPGASIPVDGIIVKGNSFVDQSSLTGESIPVEKTQGLEVFAGTLNQSGILEVQVKRVGQDTTFGRIIAIIEEAEQSRAPIQKTADKLAARLVYLALAGAAITWLFTHNAVSAIAALVAAGACGVAAGTPLAVLAGIGRVAKEGIIVKGGVYLEQLATVDTVILDKTGTLTLGEPAVMNVECFNGISKEEVLQLAASVEQHSEHPIAAAINSKAKTDKLPLFSYTNVQYLPGQGMIGIINNDEILVGNSNLAAQKAGDFDTAVSAYLGREREKGYTTVFVLQNNTIAGAISVADVIRPEARQAIEAMKKLDCRVLLLTGDQKTVATAVARSLGVDEVYAEMLPAEKMEKVRALMQSGKKIAMVGDGINDAAALAEATVGIAMASGTAVALESADMTLMNNNLLKIAEALQISRQCMNVILFNFWGTVIVDICGISLAFAGYITPLGAALIHVISELTFILNSARLFRK